MNKQKNLTGQRFERWTVIGKVGLSKGRNVLWQCKCDCGITRVVLGFTLRNRASRSCGCLQRDLRLTHGLTKYPLYKTHCRMLDRCYDPTCTHYKYYGGRTIPIQVCDRLRHSLFAFTEHMGEKPTQQHSIDRIDNDGHYSCGQCVHCEREGWTNNLRWASRETQARNQRKIRSTNKSGYRGVCFDKKTNKWMAYIHARDQIMNLGFFKTKEEAAQKRKEIEEREWNLLESKN